MANQQHSPNSPSSKMFAVLRTVARLRSAPVSAIADQLDIPVPTAHRICRQLERLGLLQRTPGARSWSVGPLAIDLAADVLAAGSSLAVPHGILRALTQEIGEMCSLAIQVGDEVVYVASAESPHGLAVSFRAGRRAPLCCTSSGKLFLSRLSDRELRAFLEASPPVKFTQWTITDAERLVAEVGRVREQGFATTNQEYLMHVVGAAVPVTGPDNTLYAALSVTAPDVRTSLVRLHDFVPALKRAAAQLALFYTGRPHRTAAGERLLPQRA
jgi:DNA-binding IclR family transcriptional regulator